MFGFAFVGPTYSALLLVKHRKGAGLAIIWGSICCEDHFEWLVFECFTSLPVPETRFSLLNLFTNYIQVTPLLSVNSGIG